MVTMKKIFTSTIILISIFQLSSYSQEYKSSIKFGTSAMCFPVHYSYVSINNLPEITLQRELKHHLILGGSFSFWNDKHYNNFWIQRAGVYNNFTDCGTGNTTPTENFIVAREKYKYFDMTIGHRSKIANFENQNIIFGIGASVASGINHRYFDESYSQKKNFYLGPIFQFEYNVNPFKNRLSFGVYATSRYYKELKWEFDPGIQAGVSF